MLKLYGNPNMEISDEEFKFPESGVSVPINCNKIKELEIEEEF